MIHLYSATSRDSGTNNPHLLNGCGSSCKFYTSINFVLRLKTCRNCALNHSLLQSRADKIPYQMNSCIDFDRIEKLCPATNAKPGYSNSFVAENI